MIMYGNGMQARDHGAAKRRKAKIDGFHLSLKQRMCKTSKGSFCEGT